MKAFFSFLFLLSTAVHSFGQTSDTQFREPLVSVLQTIQEQYGISIRYPENLVRDRFVTYARWRFRPDVEKTLEAVLASQAISFSKEGEKKYKLQPFAYHLKTVEEGREQLQHLASLHNNREGWEKRAAELKSCIQKTLGFTVISRREPLQPVLTPVRKMNGYTVQNIALETFPGVFVSGSLYRPIKTKGRVPLILNPDGHFSRGRYRADAQYRCAMLARAGAMAFSYDLFGWDGESLLQVQATDHRRSMVQSIQTFNAMRILDYLLSRPDVDTLRVGITGASGGGSQAMLLAAIDDRIRLSVPVAMLSSYHSGGCPCESGMGTHLCGGGTNNVELASMAAPAPQLIISDGKDWTRHVPEKEFPFLQKIYAYYGAENKVRNVHLEQEGHDYGFSKRRAMYEFVANHFNLDLKRITNRQGDVDESGIVIEAEDQLYVFGKKGEKLPSHALLHFDAIVKSFLTSVSR